MARCREWMKRLKTEPAGRRHDRHQKRTKDIRESDIRARMRLELTRGTFGVPDICDTVSVAIPRASWTGGIEVRDIEADRDNVTGKILCRTGIRKGGSRLQFHMAYSHNKCRYDNDTSAVMGVEENRPRQRHSHKQTDPSEGRTNADDGMANGITTYTSAPDSLRQSRRNLRIAQRRKRK